MTPPTSMRRESPTPSGQPPSRTATEKNSSDNESGGEKPVREKLREASIHGQSQDPSRGRLQKKRSFEDVESEGDEKEQEGTRHVRKRSREAVPGSDVLLDKASEEAVNGSKTRSATPEMMDAETNSGLTSPKNKRTRDQVLLDEKAAITTAKEDAEVLVTEDAPAKRGSASEERKTKRHRDSGSPPPASEKATTSATSTSIPPTSGFANTSAVSPFGAPIKSPQPSANADSKFLPQTSDDKFKTSGFGSFAKAASPFGAPASAFSDASKLASPWASKPATPATQPSVFAAAAPSTSSGFGNTSSTSAFSSLGGSKLGGGFGGSATLSGFGAAAPTTGLSAFSGGSGPTIQGLSSKKVKAFGAANDTDEEEDADSDADASEGVKSPVHVHADGGERKDKRFYEQAHETGEEGETNMFSQRSKLYQFVKDEGKWVERGMGTLKLNVEEIPREKGDGEGKAKAVDASGDGEGEGTVENPKLKARFLMRADGSQRVVLNSALRKGTNFGDLEGKEPKGQTIMFFGVMGGDKLETLQMKMNAERAKALWRMVKELQERL